MRVLVAPGGFTGSLPALQVATAIGQGLEAAGVASRLLPLADGGDGSVAAAVHAGSAPRSVLVRGADGRRHHTEFAFDGTTAVVEAAGTCGPSTLPPGVLAPMASFSHGFGQAVLTALDAGAGRIVLCLGGSASTDGRRRPGRRTRRRARRGRPGTGLVREILTCPWLGARRVAGADFFLDLLGFDAAVADCAVVVTGEGRMDGQTLAGKLCVVVAARSAPRLVSAVVGQRC